MNQQKNTSDLLEQIRCSGKSVIPIVLCSQSKREELFKLNYENGKEYVFKSNGCTAKVTLENFKPETKEKFNKVLAYEKLKAYNSKQMEENVAN